jgi:hypothetical protein
MFKTRSSKIIKPKLIDIKSENNTNILIVKIICGKAHSLLLSLEKISMRSVKIILDISEIILFQTK